MALEDLTPIGGTADEWLPSVTWSDLKDALQPYTGTEGKDKDKGGGGKGGGKDGPGKGTHVPRDPGDGSGGNGPGTGGGGGGDSASAIIGSFLGQYGLGELGDWAWQRWKNGDSIQEIMLKIRDQPAYKARFPGMDALAQKGRAINETQYVQYEYQVANLSRKYGIPDGVYNSREGVAGLLANDLSPLEIDANMRRAAAVVYGSPEIRQQFSKFYGVQGDGAAIAYFLDPEANQAALQKVYDTTVVGGAALAQGIDSSFETADRIATLVGPSGQQAQQASYRAGQDRGLYTNLIGEAGRVTGDQGLLAAYGADAAAQAAVDKRRAERIASYQGGGGLAAGASGVSGLASAAQ